MTEGKVKVGFFSFTEITDAAEHRSYNEWHQLDHLPEQFPLRGIAYGQRWVSTPACRVTREVSGDLLDPIHYVTLYLVSEPVEETLAEFVEWGRELSRRGRFHLHRRALLSGPFVLRDAAAAPRVQISAAAVPYRPHLGVFVTVEELVAGPMPTALDVMCATPGVAGAWSFADEQHRITVAWLDGAPLDVAGALPPPPPNAIFAGPFETITPFEWSWFEQ
jgi:hypothetical protein